MKKTKNSIKKHILSVILTAALLIGMAPIGVFAADTSSGNVDVETAAFSTGSFSSFALGGENSIEYYGRTALSAMPNSTALLYAYDHIVSGIGASETEISVYNGKNAITQAEIETVLDAYRRDHTEHFWIGNSYSISYNGSTVISLKPSYLMSGAKLKTAKEEFDKAVNELLLGITPTMSEYEREKLLHDRLAANISYESTANAHNAYGAIVEEKAVCEGYSEAYQYLLQQAGLQSFIVTGTSVNPATSTPEGHAWNIVRIDGSYYHVDLTWNDQGRYLFYAYFNKTDARIKEDHAITETAYALPDCNSEVADYFTVNGGKMENFNAETVGAMIKKGGLTARFYVTGDKTAFINAFKTNIRTVAALAGVSGTFSYGYAGIGREYILSISSSGHTDDVTCQHSYKTATTKATFSQNGKAVKNCKYCGKIASATAIYKVSSVKLSATSYTYNGKVRKPSVTVKDFKGKTLKNGTDYTLTYASGCKNVGKYTVKITLKGNYSGSKTLSFKINPQATTLKSLSAGKKKITAKWNKKTTQTTGYQIQYSTSSKFKNAKTITVSKNKTISKTIKNLKGGKKYYVRVRTYKMVKNTKYYSSWSAKKSVTAKK